MLEPVIRSARPEEAPELTAIAQAAKRHWGYPEPWLAAAGFAALDQPGRKRLVLYGATFRTSSWRPRAFTAAAREP